MKQTPAKMCETITVGKLRITPTWYSPGEGGLALKLSAAGILEKARAARGTASHGKSLLGKEGHEEGEVGQGRDNYMYVRRRHY